MKNARWLLGMMLVVTVGCAATACGGGGGEADGSSADVAADGVDSDVVDADAVEDAGPDAADGQGDEGELPDAAGDVDDAGDADADADADPEVGDAGPDGDATDVDATDADTDAGPDGDADASDTDVEPEVIVGPDNFVGQFNIVYWAEDAAFDYAEVYAHGVFSEPLVIIGGLVDAVGWLNSDLGWDVFLPDDFWWMPFLDEVLKIDLSDDPVGLFEDELDLADAGEIVAFGEHLVAHVEEGLVEQELAYVYDSNRELGLELAELQPPAQWVSLSIEGGADIGAYDLPKAVRLPEPLAFESPDPSTQLPIRFGAPLTLHWAPPTYLPEPPAVATVLIQIAVEEFTYAARIEDTGAADLHAIFGESLSGVQQIQSVNLSRVVENWVQLYEGVLMVRAMHKQWFYPENVGAWDVEPRVWRAGVTTDVTLRVWDHGFVEGPPALTLGQGLVAEDVAVQDTDGHIVTFRVTVPAGAPTGPVSIAAAPAGGPEALLDVPRAAWVAATLPSAGDCESAVDEGPLGDGTWVSSDAGLEGGGFGGAESCPGGSPPGGEQAVPVALSAGQTLSAELWRQRGAPVLYIADACGSDAPVRACVAPPSAARPARLRYTATADETVLLVLDGAEAPGAEADEPDQLLLTLARDEPQPFVLTPARLAGGATASLTLTAIGADLSAGDVSLDLGEEVEVLEVSVQDATTATVSVSAGAIAANLRQDATLTVGEAVHVAADAVELIPTLATAETCAEAPTLTPGRYEGLTGPKGVVVDFPCGFIGLGSEAVFKVALGPGETLWATVTIPDGDPLVYVVPTCGDEPTTCPRDQVIWTGPAEATEVYLVIDSIPEDDGLPFTLELEVGP